MDFAIRKADLADLPVVAPLFDQYRQFYRQSSNIASAEEFFRQRLERNESVVLLAARADAVANTGVGFVQLYPSFSSIRMSRIWILNDLFVAPKFRKLGVARELLRQTKAFAVQRGASKIALSTARDNHAAQSLYQSEGYRLDSEFLQFSLSLCGAG